MDNANQGAVRSQSESFNTRTPTQPLNQGPKTHPDATQPVNCQCPNRVINVKLVEKGHSQDSHNATDEPHYYGLIWPHHGAACCWQTIIMKGQCTWEGAACKHFMSASSAYIMDHGVCANTAGGASCLSYKCLLCAMEWVETRQAALLVRDPSTYSAS